MTDPATDERAQVDQDRSDAGTASPPEVEVMRKVAQMLEEGRALVRDYLDLLAVEGQLAGRSLVLMLALAIVFGVVLVATWMFLNLAGVMWLVEHDILSASQALLASSVAHGFLALLIWFSVRHLSRNLVFGGFRKALQREKSSSDLERR